MKKLLVLIFVLCATGLFAANLVNKDSKRYGLEIKTVGTTHTSINGSTTVHQGAPDGATITIKETGSTLKVSGSNDVVIKDGRLSQ